MKELWNEFLEMKLDPDIRGCIIELNHQMEIFDYFNGVKLGSLFLKQSDNVSHTMQHIHICLLQLSTSSSISNKNRSEVFLLF